MHAVRRRMPAERARHAKRLGHVQAASNPAVLPVNPGPILGTSTSAATTTSQQSTPPPVTSSSNHTAASTASSSSAPPSSSTAQSSSSGTTSSTSTIPPLTSTEAISSSISAPSTASISATPTQSVSPHTDATSGGLSGGAIAGIIAGGVIVGVALIVFFIRKTYLRRRERKRISWTGAQGLGTGSLDEHKLFPDANERQAIMSASSPRGSVPASPFDPHGQSLYSIPVSPGVNTQPPSFPPYAVPPPPPATYNNPAPVAVYPAQVAPSIYGPGNTILAPMAGAAPGTRTSSIRAQQSPIEALVKFSFVPTLPDELSITTGERVFVVEEYDDGWNLCANGRGERGMVPRECLESTPAEQLDIVWRNVQRMSSLNSEGRRY